MRYQEAAAADSVASVMVGEVTVALRDESDMQLLTC